MHHEIRLLTTGLSFERPMNGRSAVKKSFMAGRIFLPFIIISSFILSSLVCSGCASHEETSVEPIAKKEGTVAPSEHASSENASSEHAPSENGARSNQPVGRGPRPNAKNAAISADDPIVVKSSPASRTTTIAPAVIGYSEYHDPLIKFNRAMFAFNDFTYRYALIPLGNGYRKHVPSLLKTGISNFFYNIKSPIYIMNHLLQGNPKSAGESLTRFGINTTIGLLGIFDPAHDWWQLDREETHFENTLAHYDRGYGIYLVLPFFGPSDMRNGASLVVDYLLNPVTWLVDSPQNTEMQALDGFQAFAPKAERYMPLRDQSKDPYIFFRNLHLQGLQRDAEF